MWGNDAMYSYDPEERASRADLHVNIGVDRLSRSIASTPLRSGGMLAVGISGGECWYMVAGGTRHQSGLSALCQSRAHKVELIPGHHKSRSFSCWNAEPGTFQVRRWARETYSFLSCEYAIHQSYVTAFHPPPTAPPVPTSIGTVRRRV